MDIIDIIIKENLDKFILKESISSIVYHFTDIDALIDILDEDKFRLSSKYGLSGGEDYGREGFYLSVSRIKSHRTGYPYAIGLDVRITLNGDKLNQIYRGKPVDFYSIPPNITGGKQSYYIKGGNIPYQQEDTENEDRVFSYSPSISNVWKYIERIDILAKGKYQFSRLAYILNKYGDSKKIYIYDNPNSFEFQTRDTINNYILSQNSIYTPKMELDAKKDGRLAKAVSQIIGFILTYIDVQTFDEAEKYTQDLLNKYGLSEYNEFVDSMLRISGLGRMPLDAYQPGDALRCLWHTKLYYKFGKMLGDFCRKNKIKNLSK